ncbi:MAG: FHA domain-containing protein [Microcystaceae cyanobacterium]
MKISHAPLSSTDVLTHHILVIEIQGSQQIIYLSKEQYLIGRKANNDIVIKSDKVSRYHATIIRRIDKNTGDYTYWIVDGDLAGNKSHNGIFINRKRQFVHNLNSGDVVHLSPEIKASYHRIYHSAENQGYLLNKTVPTFPSVSSHQTIHKNTLITVDPLSNHLKENNYSAKDTYNELSNYQLFTDYLSHSLDNAKRQQYLLGLGLLEVENFTNLSAALKERLSPIIYQRLKSTLRQGDFICFWQEGQFMLLLSHLKTADSLIRLAPRILSCFEIPISLEDNETSLQKEIRLLN